MIAHIKTMKENTSNYTNIDIDININNYIKTYLKELKNEQDTNIKKKILKTNYIKKYFYKEKEKQLYERKNTHFLIISNIYNYVAIFKKLLNRNIIKKIFTKIPEEIKQKYKELTGKELVNINQIDTDAEERINKLETLNNFNNIKQIYNKYNKKNKKNMISYYIRFKSIDKGRHVEYENNKNNMTMNNDAELINNINKEMTSIEGKLFNNNNYFNDTYKNQKKIYKEFKYKTIMSYNNLLKELEKINLEIIDDFKKLYLDSPTASPLYSPPASSPEGDYVQITNNYSIVSNPEISPIQLTPQRPSIPPRREN